MLAGREAEERYLVIDGIHDEVWQSDVKLKANGVDWGRTR